LDSKIFDIVYKEWSNPDRPKKNFWPIMGNRFNYVNAEACRSDFKNERKARGLLGVQTENFEQNKSNHPRILLFDIETSPIQVLTWGLFDQNITQQQVVEDWHLMSWSAKWLFDDDIVTEYLTPDEARRHDDKRLCKGIWEMLDDADIVIGHNIEKFDCKKLNTRFLMNGLFSPSHYNTIDTLKVARDNFSFSRNSLNYINEQLGLPMKTETNFKLWKDAYFGDELALRELARYNANDTSILEDLFLRFRPYIRNMPNMNMWNEDNVSVCPNCGSEKIVWNGKFYYTFTGKYKAFRCDSCGAIGRSRKTEVSKEKRETIVR